MPKKRKLNSKNPKYWDKSQLTEKVIKRKVLLGNVPIRGRKYDSKPNGTCAMHAIWYE